MIGSMPSGTTTAGLAAWGTTAAAIGFGAGAAPTCGAAVWGIGSPLLTVIFRSRLRVEIIEMRFVDQFQDMQTSSSLIP